MHGDPIPKIIEALAIEFAMPQFPSRQIVNAIRAFFPHCGLLPRISHLRTIEIGYGWRSVRLTINAPDPTLPSKREEREEQCMVS